MAGVLDYAAGDTLIHRLNPITKIVISLCICISAFLTDNFAVLFALLALNIGIGVLGGIPKRTFSLLSGLAAICAFLFILQVIFIRSGEPVFLFVTDEGLTVAGLVAMRLIDATMPLALMLGLTQMNDLSNALVKVMHLPYKYAFTLTTALKFIPVFTNEMSLIIEAQKARGVEFDTRNPVRKVRLMLPLCVPLLVSSVGRIEQNAMSAEVRGFYLRNRRSGFKQYPFALRDAAVTLVMIAIAASVIVL